MSKIPDMIEAIVGAIVGTALADGTIQDEERVVLRGVIDQFGLEEGDLVRIIENHPKPVLIDTGEGSEMERLQLMRYAVLAAQADGRIEQSEYGFLRELGERLGLTEEEWTELEELSTQLYKATRGGTVSEKNLGKILERYIG